ncbi:hypothetical protein DL89DRAFT_320606 [Linderina pennispora]|uniref:Uncharacterized protein n=1 Tax=Linderina pennispora TaxID=61395 RepID=A0A1Y1WHB2_9FUNG|nr:uncharacterized protein DL89DRAFT_320606 [Linderina pennispora]ORX72852.1 hypothetical protein DL89DRAFT_320606 [Linderina pennispora]
MLHPAAGISVGGRVKRWLAIIVVAALAYKLLSVLVALVQPPGYRRHPVAHQEDNSEQHTMADLSCAANPLDSAVWRYSGNSTPFAVPAKPGPLYIEAGNPVCIRVVVPPAQPGGDSAKTSKQMTHLFQPLAGNPMHWDSIILDAVGQKSGVSVPIHLHPVRHLSMIDRGFVHSGLLEYRDAMWNYEHPSKVPPYAPEAISADFEIAVSVRHSSPYHLNNYAKLPFCEHADVHGRWLRGYTYSEFLQCLDVNRPLSPDRGEPYTIHWFGDTNSRRALKKITSLGDWCSGNDLGSAKCQCDDSSEGFGRFTGQNKVRDSLIHLNDEDGGWSVSEDGKHKGRTVTSPLARIHFHRWEGLTAVGKFHRADLVVLSLVNIDVSFGTFLEYTHALDELVRHLRSHYAETAIVLRTPQYFCCRAPSGAPLRRMQKDRNMQFYDYTHRLLKHSFGSLLRVWDAGGITEALPMTKRKAISRCGINANHLLINSLCNLPSVNRVEYAEHELA